MNTMHFSLRTKLLRCLALLALVAMLSGCVRAETVQGDLSERFNDYETFEFNGTAYRVRKRLTTMLLVGVTKETAGEHAGEGRAEFVAMLAVDDDAKRVTLVELDSLTQAAGPEEALPLRELFSLGEDAEAGCQLLLAAVNDLMPLPVLEHYLALDSDGLVAYDPGSVEGLDAAAVFKNRLKVLKALAEQLSTDQLNDLFYTLSDYIVTDMKSGAIMKIIDKADRYEPAPSACVPGEYVPEGDADRFVPDEDALMEILLSTFLEEDPW